MGLAAEPALRTCFESAVPIEQPARTVTVRASYLPDSGLVFHTVVLVLKISGIATGAAIPEKCSVTKRIS
jgi:hypothetical protein